MKVVTARDANHNFSRWLTAAEAGETVLITKNGKPVAELRPRRLAKRDDPEWIAAYREMLRMMEATPITGFRVGGITVDDKYGDAP